MFPDFTPQGIVPPYVGGDPTIPNMMSPYHVTMSQFVVWFGYTSARLEIISGLLDYRAQLMALGITGFQWLSGSFVEKVEETQRRNPVDVDVVTFFNRPPGLEDDDWDGFLEGDNGFLFNDSQALKEAFHCDGYTINLNEEPVDVVNLTRYWFGLFSHQRFTSFWKGMLAVELDAQQDADARSMIAQKISPSPSQP